MSDIEKDLIDWYDKPILQKKMDKLSVSFSDSTGKTMTHSWSKNAKWSIDTTG